MPDPVPALPADPPVPASEPSAREVALACARAAAAKRGENILVLEVKDLILITHYFVISSGTNRRQVQAIADETTKRMKELGVRLTGREGYREATWVLLDYQDVIVHVFLKEMREYYDLELHWGDAPRVPLD